MSLIHCPHCGNTISDRASTCPKCGYDLTQGGEDGGGNNSSNKVIIAIVAAIVVVALIGGGLYWKKQHDQQVAEQQRQEQLQREQQAEQARQQALAQAEKAKEDELWNNYETPDLKMFGLKGFVKKVVLNLSGDNMAGGVYTFTFNTKGHITAISNDKHRYKITRNGAGQMTEFAYSADDPEEEISKGKDCDIEYQGNSPSAINFSGWGDGNWNNSSSEFSYDENQQVSGYRYYESFGNPQDGMMKRISFTENRASDNHLVRRSTFKGSIGSPNNGYNVWTQTITLDIYYYDRNEIDLKGMLQGAQ